MLKNKNILLYWHDEQLPDPLMATRKDWEEKCQGWSVCVFSRSTALAYLEEHFPSQVAENFKACRIPAMQSDLFRVMFILREGGLYSDWTFAPTKTPDFMSQDEGMTCVRFHHGRVVNGLFYARAGSRALELVSEAINHNIENRTGNNIWLVTGPGAWIVTLKKVDWAGVSIVDQKDIFSTDIERSRHRSLTRGTSDHWSERQVVESIFNG